VVIVPKYRKKRLFDRVWREVGKIIRQLCRQKEEDLIEGQACPDWNGVPVLSWVGNSILFLLSAIMADIKHSSMVL
jgi:hypothetical protein